MALLRFFCRFIRPQITSFSLLLLMMVIVPFIDAFNPYLLKMMIDKMIRFEGPKEQIFSVIWILLVVYIGLWIVYDVLGRLRSYVFLKVMPPLKAKMREEIFNYLGQHSYRYFQDHLAGSLSNKVLDMVRGFEAIVRTFIFSFFGTFFLVFFSLGLLASINLRFAVCLLIWVLFFWATVVLFTKKIISYSDSHSEANSQLSGRIVDSIRNMAAVRTFAREKYENYFLKTYQDDEVKKAQKMYLSILKMEIFFGTSSVLLLATMLILFIVGWQNDWVSVGDFTYVTTISATLVMYVWWAAEHFITFMQELGVCRQAIAIMKAPHEIKDAPDAKDLALTEGAITFDDVTFHYTPHRNLFKNKNVSIKPGEKVGLVGFSGSGKSTFVNLILRYFDLEGGRILIDGQDIAHVTQDSLRKNITFVPQDTMLFHRTLRENILYGNPQATDAQMIEASKKAHCHEFIMDLEKQYDSIVGEGGIKLSGGQRQRIAIARAFLKNSPILLLDEATSSLDSVTERSIQGCFQELMEQKTTVVIAHRLSTLGSMDRILVFKEGEIIESGPHQELLALGGHYAHLWKMQMDGFLPDKENQ